MESDSDHLTKLASHLLVSPAKVVLVKPELSIHRFHQLCYDYDFHGPHCDFERDDVQHLHLGKQDATCKDCSITTTAVDKSKHS